MDPCSRRARKSLFPCSSRESVARRHRSAKSLMHLVHQMVILGINYSQMHDSSACVVRDGELLFAVAEERISRLKHDSRFPQLAIQACLEFAQARTGQVDEVCFGWQTAGPVYRHDLKLYALGKWPITYLNLLNSTRHFASMWHQESGARRFMQHLAIRRRGCVLWTII